ncbi:hypothetical protein [Streptococcus suis]|uniref:Uncharacterized protein n=1 Tax=Streptococcus suis TaxID=1307 RepID=A0A9X4MV49_STRSU|nr:hypothetical protein [Streptococcus suis]MDG4515442.1 hypothetical protein [Streptococcus suis]
MGGWKYYQNAMLPECKPHEEVDISVFDDKKLWQKQWKKVLFAKYTSDWDCEEETGWYWCIKDDPFDMSDVKAKYRYEIRKGIENFDVKVINPSEYTDQLYDVTVDALRQYPKAYQNIPNKETFLKQIPTWKVPTFAAFDKMGGIVGYINMVEREEVFYFSSLRVKKECEKHFVNHALVYGMLQYYNNKLANGCYIVDGERNINHVTSFQDFLCKKFNFRKANCRLNIIYRPGLKLFVNILYNFKGILQKADNLSVVHKINGVLKMEEICRKNSIS